MSGYICLDCGEALPAGTSCPCSMMAEDEDYEMADDDEGFEISEDD